MRSAPLAAALLLAGCLAPVPSAAPDGGGGPAAREAAVVDTDLGAFTMVLYPEAAPRTVENFRELAEGGFYDGVLFHRVIDDFVIQTGDPTGLGDGGSERTVPGEPGLHFAAGAVGMARDPDPDSATSQWFVCEYPQPHLHDPPPESAYGTFTAFAQVVEGMDVVRAIAETGTFASSAPEAVPRGVLPDRPVEEVRIRSIRIEPWTPPEDLAGALPWRTTGRWIEPEWRTTLQTPGDLAAGEPATLQWFAQKRTRDAEPPRDTVVVARAADGSTLEWPAARHPEDPFVRVAEAVFPAPGAWNLTLRAGERTVAQFDLDVPAARPQAG